MNSELEKLNKNELLNIISKMKKKELIEIINNKNGGNNNETDNAIRIPIIFKKEKIKENNNNVMANNSIYNKIYENKK